MDWWERVETRELLNPRINDLQGEITGTGGLHDREKIKRRLPENLCWVGEELMGLQCEKRDFVRCWESFY